MSEHSPAPNFYRSIYGFALFFAGQLLFVCYLLWSLVPDQIFEKLGITYLPDKYWAVAVPIFLLNSLALFTFVIYPAVNFTITPNIDDERVINGDVKEVVKERKRRRGRRISQGSNKCLAHKGECLKDCGGDYLDNPCLIPPARELNVIETCKNLYL